jgi:hypothetical protein
LWKWWKFVKALYWSWAIILVGGVSSPSLASGRVVETALQAEKMFVKGMTIFEQGLGLEGRRGLHKVTTGPMFQWIVMVETMDSDAARMGLL